MNDNMQHIMVTGDSAVLLATLYRRRNARIQIQIQARDMSARLNETEEKDVLALAAAAMYEAFAVAADIRIKRYEFEQRSKVYCNTIRDDMAD